MQQRISCASLPSPRRNVASKNVIAGWGAGTLFRFLTLVVYAVVAAKALAMPPAAALISMAAFFFVTTLIEPLLLKL